MPNPFYFFPVQPGFLSIHSGFCFKAVCPWPDASDMNEKWGRGRIGVAA
jgi:hypothetical protein